MPEQTKTNNSLIKKAFYTLVVTAIVGICGAVWGHEGRIAKSETSQKHVIDRIDRLEVSVMTRQHIIEDKIDNILLKI